MSIWEYVRRNEMLPPITDADPGDETNLFTTRDNFISQLRRESGRLSITECPLCGSGAWDEDDDHAFCPDCGFDSAMRRTCRPVLSDAYEQSDPKHPDYHSIHADIWDLREGK